MKRKINYLCLFVYWLLGNVRSSAHCAFLFVSRPSGFVAGVAGKHRWSHPIDFLTTLTLTPATTAQVDRETVANDKKNSIEMYENGNEEGRRTGDVAARWRNSASTSWNRKKAGRNNERKCIFFPERIQFSIDFVLSGTRISWPWKSTWKRWEYTFHPAPGLAWSLFTRCFFFLFFFQLTIVSLSLSLSLSASALLEVGGDGAYDGHGDDGGSIISYIGSLKAIKCGWCSSCNYCPPTTISLWGKLPYSNNNSRRDARKTQNTKHTHTHTSRWWKNRQDHFRTSTTKATIATTTTTTTATATRAEGSAGRSRRNDYPN